MLKHFLAVMLLFVMAAGVFSQSIPSGTGRYAALGSSPFILDAHIDVLGNPAWSNYYRDYAYADLSPFNGSEFTGHAGFQIAVGKQWNLGAIINKTSDAWDLMGDSASTPVVPTRILIGYTASKNFHLGLAPYFRMGGNKVVSSDSAASVYENTSSSLGADLGFIYMIKKGWIEGDLMFRMNSFENTAPSTTYKNDGGMEFGANFRAWIYPSKKNKLAVIPVLGFYTFSFQNQLTVSGTTTNENKNTWMDINGGVGLNWPVMDDIQIAGGLRAHYMTYKSEPDSGNAFESTNFLVPHWNLAVESRVTDWITVRAGFDRGVQRVSQDYPNASATEFSYTDQTSPSTTFSIGSGFHFGRLSIDATLGEAWLKHGPNFLSGGDGNDIFGIVSMSYNFHK
jgi:hypothetical protein